MIMMCSDGVPWCTVISKVVGQPSQPRKPRLSQSKAASLLGANGHVRPKPLLFDLP